MTRVTVKIGISEHTLRLLEDIASFGIYGDSVDEVANRKCSTWNNRACRSSAIRVATKRRRFTLRKGLAHDELRYRSQLCRRS